MIAHAFNVQVIYTSYNPYKDKYANPEIFNFNVMTKAVGVSFDGSGHFERTTEKFLKDLHARAQQNEASDFVITTQRVNAKNISAVEKFASSTQYAKYAIGIGLTLCVAGLIVMGMDFY